MTLIKLMDKCLLLKYTLNTELTKNMIKYKLFH